MKSKSGSALRPVAERSEGRQAIAARYEATLALILRVTKDGPKGTTELARIAVEAGVLDAAQTHVLPTYISRWKREGSLSADRIIRGGKREANVWPNVLQFVLKQSKRGPMQIPTLESAAVKLGLLTPEQVPQLRKKILKWKRQGKLNDNQFRHGRTSPLLARLRENLITDITDPLAAEGRKISSRGVWYRLIAGGHIDKDPNSPGYYSAQALNVVLNELREEGRVSFDVIEDATRQIIEPFTFKGPRAAIEYAADVHELDLWKGLPTRVIVLEEKHGLEGTFRLVTNPLQVPLLATGGYNSRTMAHKICEIVEQHSGETYVLMFGDHDADGEYAHDKIENYTRDHFERHFGGDGDQLVFERIAVTGRQIEKFGLITRDANRNSNRHQWWCEKFGKNEPCCEIDAIEPHDLEAIIQESIMRFIPADHIEKITRKQDAQRKTIRRAAAQLKPD